MKKILFIASHRLGRSPGQRFRWEQYMGYLDKNGFNCDFEYMISTEDDRVFYSPGKLLKKGMIFIRCWLKKYRDTVKARDYDIVFIQREAFMTGSVYFEKRFRKACPRLVFDFDDSIWLQNISDANRFFSFLKDASKTSKLIAMADQVIAGNQYLAEYAHRFNPNVTIIPTTIDTEEYKPREAPRNLNTLTIGWSGSLTTIQHFKLAVPALTEIKKKYGARIKIKIIGDANYRNDELDVISLNWNKEDELKELMSFDIGIMPLPDDEWGNGKCGLKGLQYMALGIPTIMARVGVNSEIISDGSNGYLAVTDDDWVQKLSLLIENVELRSQLGNAGRRTVIDRYSIDAQRENYLNLFRKML